MNKSPGWIATISLVIAGMIVSSVLTLGTATGIGYVLLHRAQSTSTSTPGSGGAVAENSWVKTASIIGPSAVSIQVMTAQGEAEGSGIIYSSDGTVVTNAHVVDGAQSISVTLSNGVSYTATIVGADSSTDIALVKMNDAPKDLTVATFADSQTLKVGEDVMAVGAPLGLENTATTGIVSALNRPVVTSAGSAQDAQSASFTSAIQTDASVNPGNSGGPLVNRAGEVVGINSSIASNATSSSTAGSIGLGFAIPSNTVKLIADQIAKTGKAQHALLGVRIEDGSVKSGSIGIHGAAINQVTSGSAAEKAGLAQGDVITAVDGVPMGSAAALTAYVRSLPLGSSHDITYYRGGKESTAHVQLDAA